MTPDQSSYTIWVIVTNVYYLLTMLFFYRNKELTSVTVRLPRFVGLCSFFGQVLFNFYLTYNFDFIYYGTPGFVHLWIQYIFIPGWLYCNLLRDLYLFFLHFLNESRMAANSAKGGYTETKMETSGKLITFSQHTLYHYTMPTNSCTFEFFYVLLIDSYHYCSQNLYFNYIPTNSQNP